VTRGGPWFPPLVSVELDPEVDNLRQAIDWWRDAGRLEEMALLAASTVNEFHAHARFTDVEEWLQAALAEDALPRALRARCLAGWAIAVEMRGDFPLASHIAEQAIATAERPSDAAGAHGILVHNLAWVAPDEAERLLENAAEWAKPLGTAAPGVIGQARAIVACARDDYDAAVAHISGVDNVDDGDIFGGSASAIVATVRILHGELDEAEAILESVSLSDQRWTRYYLPLLRGIIDARRGDIAGAREKVRDSVTNSRRWKIPLATFDGVLGCAAIAFHAGRIERASELLACIAAASGGALRTPMSMCLYRYYRRAVRAALDAATVARARSAGKNLSLEAALAAEI
jgi:hypothetical protein